MEHSFCFEAGHACLDIEGACSFPHGHSYVLILKRRGQELQADYNSIHAIVQNLIDSSFHHKWLNDSLGTNQPDLAYIANYIANHLKDKISNLSFLRIQDSLDHFIEIKDF